MSDRERFDFAFDSRFLPFLFGVGVTPGTAFVVLTAHDRLLARLEAGERVFSSHARRMSRIVTVPPRRRATNPRPCASQ